MLLSAASAEVSLSDLYSPSTPDSRLASPDGLDHGFATSKPGPGYRLLIFATNTPATKHAVHVAKTIFLDKTSEVVLAYCSQNPFYHEGMERTLDTLADSMHGFNVRTEIFEKKDDQGLVEALEEYAESMNPDIVVISSSTLCNDDSNQVKRTSWSGAASNPAIKPSRQAFAMKLCQAIRNIPVLVVKANSKGNMMSSHNIHPGPTKYMIDLQPSCRHLLAWMMNGLMDAGRDLLFLAVSKAYDANNVVTPTAVRMFTAFNVQCSVNRFKPERRLLKGPPEKALPQAVTEDEVDMLVIQAPRSRDLSPYAMNVLCSCATSVLIFPPSFENTALGQTPLPTEDMRLPRIPSATPSSRANRSVSRVSVSYDGSAASAAAAQIPSPTASILPPRPMGSARRRPVSYSMSGTGYSYTARALPRPDAATDAALEAIADRASRRKQLEERQLTMLTSHQRARSGALELEALREGGPPPALARMVSIRKL